MSARIKRNLKRTALYVYGILAGPIPQKHVPPVVLKPQKKFPFLKPMLDIDYEKELKKKRVL